MEFARGANHNAGAGTGRGAGAGGADRPTDQRRVPDRRINAGGQHHDSRAGGGSGAVAAISARRQCTIIVAASDRIGRSGAGGGEKAGDAETHAADGVGQACAGFARAGHTCGRHVTRSTSLGCRGGQRMMLSKIAAHR